MYDYAQYSYQHTHDMYTYVAQILFQSCVKFAYFGETDAKLCRTSGKLRVLRVSDKGAWHWGLRLTVSQLRGGQLVSTFNHQFCVNWVCVCACGCKMESDKSQLRAIQYKIGIVKF